MINKNRIISLFEELVAVPCPSKGEKQEAELIISKLQELGIAYEMDDANKHTGGEVGNIWAYIPANIEGVPCVFFEAHMDSVAPCTGTHVIHKDGIMYSDGTTTLGGDDKVGIASMLELARALKEDGIPHGAVQLCFTISEEIGCLGAKYMDKSKIKADFGYCLDMGGSMGEIVYAAPKMYDIYVTVKGKAAHAGLEPEKGVNAIMLATAALSKFPAYGRLNANTTMNIGVFNAGVGTNIVCPEAKFCIDMRSLDVDELEELKNSTMKLIQETVEALGGKVEFEVVLASPAQNLKIEDQVVQVAAKAAKTLGYTVSYAKTGGCSDGNYICGYDLPCALIATGMSNIHTTEEFLREDDLFGAAKWAYQIIVETAKYKDV